MTGSAEAESRIGNRKEQERPPAWRQHSIAFESTPLRLHHRWPGGHLQRRLPTEHEIDLLAAAVRAFEALDPRPHRQLGTIGCTGGRSGGSSENGAGGAVNPGHARAGEYAGLTPVTKSATESGGRLASYVDRIVRGEKPAHVGCMQVFRTICYWPARSPSGLPAISIPAAPRGRGRASADLTPSLRNRWFADSPLEEAGFEPAVPLAAFHHFPSINLPIIPFIAVAVSCPRPVSGTRFPTMRIRASPPAPGPASR